MENSEVGLQLHTNGISVISLHLFFSMCYFFFLSPPLLFTSCMRHSRRASNWRCWN